MNSATVTFPPLSVPAPHCGTLAPTLLVLLLTGYGLLIPQTVRHTDKDFTHLWLAGRVVATGHGSALYDVATQETVYAVYDPSGKVPQVWGGRYELLGCFNYPPQAALLYAPFGFLSLPQAWIAHSAIALLATLLAGRWVAQVSRPAVSAAVAACCLLVYPPFLINLAVGQNAVVTLLLILGCWKHARDDCEFRAGLLLGLLIYKPNWLIAIAWLPLVHRRWRLIAGAACSAIAFTLLTAALLGPRPLFDYFHQARLVSQLPELTGYQLTLQHNALSIFRRCLGVGEPATSAGWAAALAVVGLTAFVTRRWWTNRRRRDFAIAAAAAAAMWANPHLNYYDLLLTVPCLLLAFSDWPNVPRNRRPLLLLLAIVSAIAVPLGSWAPLAERTSLAALTNLALWVWLLWRGRCHALGAA